MRIYPKAIIFLTSVFGYAILLQAESLNMLNESQAFINKGIEYVNKQDYSKAILCYEKALSINEITLQKYRYKPGDGPENPEAMRFFTAHDAIQKLAFIYEQLENYPKAIFYYKKGFSSLPKPSGGPMDEIIAQYLMAFGSVYMEISDFEKSISYNEKAIAIIEKYEGDLSLYKMDVLNELGDAHRYLGNYNKAVSYYEKALDVIEREGGPPGPATIQCWNRLAIGYEEAGNYQKAIPIYEKSLKINESIIKSGIYSPAAAIDLENLGRCYKNLSEYSKSLACFEKAFEIHKKFSGIQDSATVRVLQQLSVINFLNGNIDRAQAYAISASESQERQLQMLLSMDEKTQLSWVMNNLQFGVEPCFLKPEQIAKLIIQRKGVVLDSLMEDRSTALLSAKDKNGRKQLEEISVLRSKLTKIGFSTKIEDQNKAEQLEDQIAKLQRSLSSYSSTSKSARVRAKISIENLKASLANGECLLDFIQFSDPKLRDNQNCYGALIIGQDGEPKFVRMNGAREIDNSVKSLHCALASSDEKMLTEQQRFLTERLWAPLANQLPSDARKLVIAPDGELNFLSFATLQNSSGKFLSESYEITYVGSGRDLTRPIKSEQNKSVSLFANPIFNRQAIKFTSKSMSLRSGELNQFEKLVLHDLPGTQTESEFIQKEANDRGWEATAFTGVDANKQNLLGLKNPGILHLATHGFYLNSLTSPEENNRGLKVVGVSTNTPSAAIVRAVDPMRASGVALTGAQATLKAWAEGKVPDPLDDGILTAEEVSGLKLDGTWIVTLSACDSGVGEAKSGEGVFGLRRAFMIAGAQNLLMTLWPVSDETTAKIMADFYKNALATGDAAKSLSDVQRDWLVRLRLEKGVLAAIRDAGPFAMVVMGDPNAKPLPETIPAKISTPDSASPVAAVPLDSSDGGNVMEFNYALAKADLGDAYAQAVVSIYYGLGLGCDPDPVKSKEYVMLSAKQKNPLGIYRLAEMRETGEGMDKNTEQALQLMKKAKPDLQKLTNDPYALTALAAIYERENPASPKIRELLTKASDMGYEPAQKKLSQTNQ